MTWLLGRLPSRAFNWRGCEFHEKDSPNESIRRWSAEFSNELRLELLRNESGGEYVTWEAYAFERDAVVLAATSTQLGSDAKAAGFSALDRLYDSINQRRSGF